MRIAVAQCPALENAGDGEIWRCTRLAWLNSDLGLGDRTLPPPFTPVALGSRGLFRVEASAHASTNRWQNSFAPGWLATAACPAEFAVSPGCDPSDQRDIWALQDSFGIAESATVRWWEEATPVQSSVDAVTVTTYVRAGRSAMIVLGQLWGVPGVRATRL